LTVQLAAQVRRSVLQASRRANIGHIGSCLSIADIVAALAGVMDLEGGQERDRFILSKGHAALAWYSALHAVGRLSDEQMEGFCTDGTELGGHPEHVLPGVDFSTGSLGHGLGIGAGAALAARRQVSGRRAFVLLSDAECNEGSTWEAVMFAAHHGLSNLIAIVDMNGQQALGYTRDVLDMSPMAGRWRAFGWDVHEIDGHDVAGLQQTIAGLDTTDGPPHVLVARTIFGKGVSYMERQIKWHYWPMSDDEYARALADIEAGEPGSDAAEACARHSSGR
jgi:transketolase